MKRFIKQLVFIIIAVVVITSGVLVILAVNNRGDAPVAWWKFDEGYASTTYDAFGNNDGTLTSGARWQNEPECKSGKCLYFDGVNGSVESPWSDTYTANITFEAWVKSSKSGEEYSDYALVIDVGAFVDQGFSLSVDHASDKWSWSVYDNYFQMLSPNTVVAGKWYHLAGTYNGTVARFYVNGIEVASPSVSVGTYTGVDKISIGAQAKELNRLNRYFNGTIDNVKIYDYARSAAQIKADYTASAGGWGAGARVKASEESYFNREPDQLDGLVAHWRFDEQTSGIANHETLLDVSGSNNGTGAGSDSLTWTTGQYSSALHFDGTSDFVDVNDSDSISVGGGDFTITAWVYPESITGSRFIVSKVKDWSEKEYAFRIVDGKLGIDIEKDNNGGYGETGSASMVTSQWQHVAVVFDSSGFTTHFYRNGIEQPQSDNISALPDRFSDDLDIGKLGGSYNSDYFQGRIDDVRIYNRALSKEEMWHQYTGDYGGNPPMPYPPPVAHWKFDEQSGTTVNDTSGNNTGVLTNMDASTDRVQGKYGSALSFDGTNDYVLAGDVASMGQLTIAYWCKVTSDISSQAQCLVAKDRNDAGADSDWAMGVGAGADPFFSTWAGGYAEYDATSTLLVDTWYHLAVTFNDSDEINWYVNGIREYTFAEGSDIDTNTQPVTIGASAVAVTPQYRKGSIDDVRIYNYARTQKQIMEDMNAGHPAVGSPVGSYVGYWKFDELYGQNVYDQSVQGNNGTRASSTDVSSADPSWESKCKFGGCLSFDGSNDYVDAGTGSSLRPTQITLEAWVYLNSLSKWHHFINNTSDHNHSDGYRFTITNDNKLRFRIRDEDNNLVLVISDNTYSANQWYHFVATYDEQNLIIYANGVEVKRQAETDAIKYAASTFSIGHYLNAGDTPDGLIDEVKIYPFALTPAEVKQEYNRGATIQLGSVSTESDGITASQAGSREYCPPGDTSTCLPPVAHWKFDKQSGTIAYDTSTSSNDGILTNGPIRRGGSFCKKGACLEFDGTDDYVSAIDSTSLDLESGVTMEAWINTSSFANAWQAIVVKGDSVTDIENYALYLHNSGSLYFVFNVGGRKNLASNVVVTQTDTWYHVAATYDGATRNFFVNGLPAGSSSAVSGAMTSNNDYLEIGVRDISGLPFNGFIDDVRIYDYARTPAQIAWGYNRGGPIGWWKMDEGQDTATTCNATGATVYNYSSNTNNGTLTLGAAPTVANARVEGKFNCAIDFDGTDDRVDVAHSSELDFGSPDDKYSISTWVKTNYSAATQGVLAKGRADWTSDMPYVIVLGATGQVGFSGWDEGGSAHTEFSVATDTIVNDGVWHHIVAVYNGVSEHKIYIDGALDAIDTTTATHTITNSYKVEIGNYHNHEAPNYFNGIIDDVRIYNYALTDVQIKNVFNEGSAVRFGPSSGLP